MALILTVNAGSSSLKCGLFDTATLENVFRFKFSNILEDAQLKIFDNREKKNTTKIALPLTEVATEKRHQACLNYMSSWLKGHLGDTAIKIIGHRVVHGGIEFSQPTLLTPELIKKLEALTPLAPLHQPFNLKLVNASREMWPELPQIACFDTMFHANQPSLEQHYAIPSHYADAGIKRYGFHGLSYEFITKTLKTLFAGREISKTIVCHLGAGASMCAIKDGKSIASSMGFSAADGLPMASRCGNIDPGVLLYIQRHYQMSIDDLEQLIYRDSGWAAVSGISADMKTLEASKEESATRAIDMFCYRSALEIGRLSAALEGLDCIVFTGGIGENSVNIRANICARLQWLGAEVDNRKNTLSAVEFQNKSSSIKLLCVATDEESMIAQHCSELVQH